MRGSKSPPRPPTCAFIVTGFGFVEFVVSAGCFCPIFVFWHSKCLHVLFFGVGIWTRIADFHMFSFVSVASALFGAGVVVDFFQIILLLDQK